MNSDEAAAIKRRVRCELFRIPNVRMLGIGFKVKASQRTDIVSLRVFVERKIAADALPPSAVIPACLHGLPTDVEEVGELFALNAMPAPALAAAEELEDPLTDDPLEQVHRPLVAGIQIGVSKAENHIVPETGTIMLGIAAFRGSLGCFVETTTAPKRICALTAQHVVNRVYELDSSSLERERAGRDVYQPQAFLAANDRPLADSQTAQKGCWCSCETKQEQRRIGRVVSAKNSAKVDAALIALKGGLEYRQQLYDLQGIAGPAKGLVDIKGSRKRPTLQDPPVVQLGDLVFKFGFKTGSTAGKVIDAQLETSDLVDSVGQYRIQPEHTFVVQSSDSADPFFTQAGDSGCVVIGQTDRKVVGLLWGGRSVKKKGEKEVSEVFGLIDPIDIVESEMKCVVLTHEPGTPIKQVDSGNLDGVPHVDENGDPVAATEASPGEAAQLVLSQLRARPKGERLAEIGERAVREIVDILHDNAKARAHWVRLGGPYLAGEFLYGMCDLSNRTPQQIGPLSLVECVRGVSSVLSRAGSADLRRMLRAAAPAVCDSENATFLDVVLRLETALCQ